jgi:hypothetical protein
MFPGGCFMASHRHLLLVTVAFAFVVTGCCKEGEEQPVAAAPVSAAPPSTPDAAATTATALPTVRYNLDAGKVVVPDGGGTFGAPPSIVTGKNTGTQPTTKDPDRDTATFGGPPPIATNKKTPTPGNTQPTSTTTAFGGPPKLR